MQKGTVRMGPSPSLILAAHPVPLRGISLYATSCGFKGYKSVTGINPIRPPIRLHFLKEEKWECEVLFRSGSRLGGLLFLSAAVCRVLLRIL